MATFIRILKNDSGVHTLFDSRYYARFIGKIQNRSLITS